MTNMEPWLVSSILGFILSVPWGLAVWLKWQTMKHGTIIPFGFLTCRYGAIVGFIINAMCIVIALLYAPYPKWWLILTFGLTHYFGVWVATLIERKFYCNDDLIERILFTAYKESKSLSPEDTAAFLSIAVPSWWSKIMTLEWQQELRQKVLPILVPDNKDQ